MPRTVLTPTFAVEFHPVNPNREQLSPVDEACLPSHVLMEYVDGRHVNTQVFTTMEMRAMAMLTQTPVSPAYWEYVSLASCKRLETDKSLSNFAGRTTLIVRDFAYRLQDDGRWEYGKERIDPLNLRGVHGVKDGRHPMTVEHDDAAHAFLSAGTKLSKDHEISEFILVLTIVPPGAQHCRHVTIPPAGRKKFFDTTMEALG